MGGQCYPFLTESTTESEHKATVCILQLHVSVYMCDTRNMTTVYITTYFIVHLQFSLENYTVVFSTDVGTCFH